MSVQCAECARLEEAKRKAAAAGDKSKVTDCVVLLRRHPHHAQRQ
ncbi:hypothetical protein [Streptomyces sp. NPDC020742]